MPAFTRGDFAAFERSAYPDAEARVPPGLREWATTITARDGR